MNTSELREEIEKLDAAHDEYFRLFLEHFPLFHRNQSVFGPSDLIRQAIKLQTLASSLGPKALSRLIFIGFSKLVPFDNPVDWYNWKLYVEKNDISNNIYASIAVRIGAEIQRMKMFAEFNAWDEYAQLNTSDFIVSFQRYEIFQESPSQPIPPKENHAIAQPPSLTVHIQNNIPQHDAEAIDAVDKWDKNLSFASKIVEFIKVFF